MADQTLAANGETGSCYLFRLGVLRRSFGLTPSPRGLTIPHCPRSPAGYGAVISPPPPNLGWVGGSGLNQGCAFLREAARGGGLRDPPPTLRELGFLRGSAGQHFYFFKFVALSWSQI